MTNTETCDVDATVAQVQALERAGADIVRVSVPSMDAAEAFGKIKGQVEVPLVADIHFDYHIALRVAELGADCLRINPGNIGREDRVRAVARAHPDWFDPLGDPLTTDEETSGIVAAFDVLGPGGYFLAVQAHARTGDPETVEHGQLLRLRVPRDPGPDCPGEPD
jgi:hypothetical protein